ncbi:MAG: large subunit ribosomal protein L23 [Parcubacteria group bacterium Gr01-1014_70]|nr:MAG: large subunit ribosomal protein L23 [Parcubacteria group bacterium Gr01-1014_70]
MLGEKGTYMFVVSDTANKIMIKRAVADAFGVHVVDVRIARTPYKKVRRGRITGRKGGEKKAYVTIRPGEKIE